MSNSTTNPSQETRLAPEPLTKCAKCSYALAGLPSAHCCPECGFEFDAYSWAWAIPEDRWRSSRAWAILGHGFIIIVFGLILSKSNVFTKGWILKGDIFDVLDIFMYTLICFTDGWFLKQLLFGDPQPFIVACPEGIVIYCGTGASQGVYRYNWLRGSKRTIPWSELVDIKLAGSFLAEYRLTCKKQVWCNTKLFAKDEAELESLRSALLDAKAHYLDEPNPNDNPA